MAEHHFDIDIAEKYGVNAAIILNHLYFWVKKSKANNKNYYDGHYWTYNSVRAFEELFPYLSSRQISTALKKLESEGIIKIGNYNKSAYDRTLWYTVTEKGLDILNDSILQNRKIENTKMSNQNGENVEPIPDINTDINTDNNMSAYADDCAPDYQKIVSLFNQICVSLPKVEKLTENRKQRIKAADKELNGDFEGFFRKIEASDFLTGRKGDWCGCCFDWVFKPQNIVKIIEGNYDNKLPQSVNTGQGYHINYTIEG